MSAGFGFISKDISKNYAITVSENLDYEIQFWFKQPTRDPTFELGVKTFDCQFQQEFIPLDVVSGAAVNVLIPGNLVICSLENRWNFCHMVVYSKNEPLHNSAQPETSHAAGTNVIMRPGTAKLFVNLLCVRNCLLIWDFKVKPLRTPFSTGFLQARGLIEIWRKNNKQDMTTEQIDALAQQYLFPYDVVPSVIELA